MVNSPRYLLFFPVFLSALLLDYNNVIAAYLTSAHGTGSATNGVSGRAAGYADGNCAHCHNPHASRTGVARTPYPYVTGSNDAEADQDSALCLDCHDNSVVNVDDVAAKLSGGAYQHNVSNYAGTATHKVDESRAELSNNKHVYCVDCHNPHEAGTTKQIPKTATSNELKANSPLLGAVGAVPTGWGGNFTTATGWELRALIVGDKEYQVCFKCHASFNTNAENWGAVAPDPGAWTELDQEFNPSNASYHPVVQALPGGQQLDTKQLTDSWAPADTMYCSDCHNTQASSGAQGPHGSNVKWMLAGTNQAWPFVNAADNGKTAAASGSVFWSLWYGHPSGGANSFSGLFCMNCHPNPTDSSTGDATPNEQTNNVHTKSNHYGTATKSICVYCHLRVPHGGKVSRLIMTTGTVPARYTPDGNGSGTINIANFLKAAYRSYNKSNCKTTTAGCKGTTIGDDHYSVPGGSESW